jgi:hypothetical protein
VRVFLGAVAARRGNHDEAVLLWRQAAHDGDVYAALSLAPIEAVDGRLTEALELLYYVVDAGIEEGARRYASLLDRTATDIEIASLEAAANRGVTDALNFLGVAALMSGRKDAAKHYWSRSGQRGDWKAPILLSRLDKSEAA